MAKPDPPRWWPVSSHPHVLQSYELKLSDRTLEVIETGPASLSTPSTSDGYLPGGYTELGLTLLWDKGTSIFLRLSPECSR